jgi:hypothetical protein
MAGRSESTSSEETLNDVSVPSGKPAATWHMRCITGSRPAGRPDIGQLGSTRRSRL